ARLGVAGDQQLVGRTEVEKVTTHEARRQPVAAGQGFYLRLIPSAPLRRLVRNDEARTSQPRDLGRVAIELGGEKHLHRRGDGIVIENSGHGIGERGLAVRACAEQQHQHMPGNVCGEAVSSSEKSDDQVVPLALHLAAEARNMQRYWEELRQMTLTISSWNDIKANRNDRRIRISQGHNIVVLSV